VRALERSFPILKPDHSVKFAFLPPEHDPDSLVKDEGVGAMQRVLDSAIGLFEMMWNEETKGRDFSQPETKAGFRSALEKRARAIADGSVQQFFIHEINQKINEVFFGQGGGYTEKRERNFQPRQPQGKWGKQLPPGINTAYRPSSLKAQPIRVSKLLREKALIAAVINYPQLFEEFGEQLGMVHAANSEYDALRQELMRFLGEDLQLPENDRLYLDDQAVKQHLSELGYGKILDALFDNSLYVYAGFAKLGQPFETVRQGWQEAYTRGLDKGRWKA